jgi:hypothetical protein
MQNYVIIGLLTALLFLGWRYHEVSSDFADAQIDLYGVDGDETNPKPGSKQYIINFKDRQLNVAEITGQVHDEDWFEDHDDRVTATQALNQRLTNEGKKAMVFVGDGVIADLPVENITNKAEYERYKSGVAGDNLKSIIWRIENGEMPDAALVAFIIAHAGQKDIEDSGLTATYDTHLAISVGDKIGAFHAKLRELRPSASHISSGEIPSIPIGVDNLGAINTRIQNAIGGITTTNRYVNTSDGTTSQSVANGINSRLAGMDTAVAMSKRGAQGCQAPNFVVSIRPDNATHSVGIAWDCA